MTASASLSEERGMRLGEKYMSWVAVLALICLPVYAQNDESILEPLPLEDWSEEELARELETFNEISKEEEKLLLEEAILLDDQEKLIYRSQGYSLIPWSELDVKEWMSFPRWRNERDLKDKMPGWRITLRDKRLIETGGRVLDCIGECLIFRGSGNAHVSSRSSLQEGDEFVTRKDSYAWLYLLDGTLIRVSPNSSLTLKGFNLSPEVNFVHLRINVGNVLVLSREQQSYPTQELRETDSIFLPLKIYEANGDYRLHEYNEEDLFSMVQERSVAKEQYLRYQKLFAENNKNAHIRPTEYFIVMPNGTFVGQNIRLEMIVLLGQHSFFKNRTYEFFAPGSKVDVSSELNFFYRGYEGRKPDSVEAGKWFKVGEYGRVKAPEFDFGKMHGMAEYLTKRVPTIFVAREIFFEKYSRPIYPEKRTGENMAALNYRLWNAEDALIKDEIRKRKVFLHEYTRREETTNLLVAKRFRSKLALRGEEVETLKYGDHFYKKAVDRYYEAGEITPGYQGDRIGLNSTKKVFWYYVNSRRK